MFSYNIRMDIIAEEAFFDLQKEIERQPIACNKTRTLKVGRTQTFGLVNRRNHLPDYSRNCWLRPKLYYLLLKFAEKYVDISFNAITVNQNYQAPPHKDKGNVGVSYLVAFGDYEKGQLELLDGEKKGVYDIKRRPIKEDFSKITHQVLDFTGNRYSLVFYWYDNKRVPKDLPPGKVLLENGVYNFYRGDKLITKKEGLPHSNRKKSGIVVEKKDVVISFN